MEFKLLDIGYEPPQKKTILVVDDEISLQSIFHDSFAEQYVVISAHTGQEGLSRAETHNPDLIFMDVMLPDLNGYEAVKLLRANPDTKEIPVIIITARDFEPTTVQMLKSETNVVGFMPKPFRVAELRRAVEKILGKKKKPK